MRKIILAVLGIIILSLFLIGCAKKVSDQQLESELGKLSDEELDALISQAESGKEGALAGQAIIYNLPSSVSAAQNSQVLAVANKIKLGRMQTAVAVPPCISAPSGMISWWDGDNVSGTTVYDIKSSSNGISYGNPALVTGKVGKAFSFDGIDDYIAVGIPNSYSQMTIEAWVKLGQDPSSAYAEQAILSQDGPVSWKLTAEPLWTPEVRNVGFEYDNGYVHKKIMAGISQQTQPGEVLSLLCNLYWRHLAVTFQLSTGEVKVYIDGKESPIYSVEDLAPEVDLNNMFFPTIYLGSSVDVTSDPVFGPNHFKGFVDEVSIYDRPLSLSEAKAIYTAGGSGKCKVKLQLQMPVAAAQVISKT